MTLFGEENAWVSWTVAFLHGLTTSVMFPSGNGFMRSCVNEYAFSRMLCKLVERHVPFWHIERPINVVWIWLDDEWSCFHRSVLDLRNHKRLSYIHVNFHHRRILSYFHNVAACWLYFRPYQSFQCGKYILRQSLTYFNVLNRYTGRCHNYPHATVAAVAYARPISDLQT